MEILNRREQIGAKKLPPVIGDDVEKASKSKFGVVKIGDGINVSNGVISVAGSGGSVTIEEVWTGNITTTATDYELTKAYTGYKILFLQSLPSVNTTRGSDLIVVDLMTTTENGTNYMKAGGVDVEVKIVDSTHFNMKAGQGLNGVHIMGIK